MTIRLSASSLAGIARTLVAVGTARLAVMLVTVRAAAPRSLLTSVPSGGVGGEGRAEVGGEGRAGGGGGRARGRRGRRGRGGALEPDARLRPGSVGEGGLIVGEEAPPGSVHRTRVSQIPLVELLDQPFVGAEVGLVPVIRRGSARSRAHARTLSRLVRRAVWLAKWPGLL